MDNFTRLDQVTVAIGLTGYPNLPPDFMAEVSGGYAPGHEDEAGWHGDAALEEIRTLLRDDAGQHRPHTIDERRAVHSWGAYGVGADVVVWIANQAASAAIALALEASIRATIKRLRGNRSVMTAPHTVTFEYAREHAQRRVALRYDKDVSELEVLGELETVESWVISLRDEEGNGYVVEIEGANGVTYIHRRAFE